MNYPRNFIIYTSIGVAIGISSVAVTRIVKAQSAVRVPFTLQKVETPYHKETGLPGPSLTTTLAVRADGSSVRRRAVVTPDGKPYVITGIVDASKMQSLTFDTLTNSITTLTYTTDQLHAMTGIPTSCDIDSPAQSMTKFGFQLFKSTKPVPNATTGMTDTMVSWVAPEINCLTVAQTRYLSSGGGSSQVAFINDATSLTVGAPDPSLFVIPDGLTERPPSEVLALQAKMTHARQKPPCPNCINRDAVLDNNYYRAQHPQNR